MSTNKTANFGLHAWVETDPVLMSEFNENFAALDAFPPEIRAELAAAESTLSSSIASAKSELQGNINSVNSTLNSSINTVKSDLTSSINTVESDLASAIGTVETNLTSSINTAKSSLTSSINTVKSNLTGTINTVKADLTSSINSVDSSLSEEISAVAAELASAKAASVKLVHGTYVGDGESGKTLYFSGVPMLVMIRKSLGGSIYDSLTFIYSETQSHNFYTYNSGHRMLLTWGNNFVQWKYSGTESSPSAYALNAASVSYHYLVFYI